MGVEDAWNLLKSCGIEGVEINPRTFTGHIHVDTLSLFRSYIVATEHYILQRELRQQLPAEWDEEKRSNKLVSGINNRLSQCFNKNSVTLHFDGGCTEQKALAHKSRAEQQDAKSRNAQGAILKTDLLIHHPQDNQAKGFEHPPPTPIGEAEPANRFSRGCRRRILRSLVTAQTLSKPLVPSAAEPSTT